MVLLNTCREQSPRNNTRQVDIKIIYLKSIRDKNLVITYSLKKRFFFINYKAHIKNIK